MVESLFDLLAWAHTFTYPLGWLVVATFLAGAILEGYDRELARIVSTVAWVLFASFWFTLIEYFVFIQKSAIEGVGTLVAIPLSLYVGYKLYAGRDSLFVLSRAIAAMGLVYVPFVTVEPLRRGLIEVVTSQTAFVINSLGYNPDVAGGLHLGDWGKIAAKTYPYDSTFVFYQEDNSPITYTIKIACTGIGSMAIIAGLVAAVRAPLSRKLRALALALPIIWVLNIIRNVFISISFGEQYMQVLPGLISTVFSDPDPRMVSYYVADRIIAQSLSVVAMVVITWLVVRELPEILAVIEDLLFLVTGNEYDLQSAVGIEPPSPPDEPAEAV